VPSPGCKLHSLFWRWKDARFRRTYVTHASGDQSAEGRMVAVEGMLAAVAG